MSRTDVVFYQEDESDVPVLDWLKEIRRTDQRAYATCVAAIERLADFGHELRRPLADFLRDGIFELRVRKGRVNYRILYFFHGGVWRFWGTPLQKKTECRVPIWSGLCDERKRLKPTLSSTLIRRRRKHSHAEDERRTKDPGTGYRQ
jgi:phage-related protein